MELLIESTGVVGEAMLFFVFLLLQCNRVHPDSGFYLWTNFIGSIFILIGFIEEWDVMPLPLTIALFLVQIGWFVVSGAGIFERYQSRLRLRRRETSEAPLSPSPSLH